MVPVESVMEDWLPVEPLMEHHLPVEAVMECATGSHNHMPMEARLSWATHHCVPDSCRAEEKCHCHEPN
jgi:hypothetical protein